MFPQDLQNALDAMRKINNAQMLESFCLNTDVMTYIGKQKAVGIKKGDT